MPLTAFQDASGWLSTLRVFLVLHLLAFAAWPWFSRLFSGRADRGAGLAMSGGVLIYLLCAQWLWRAGFFEMHLVWAGLLTALIGFGGRWLLPRQDPGFGTRARMRGSFLQGWMIFSLLFGYWTLIRASDPGVNHTEQPMDMMWMRAAMAADQPPLRDAWFGGATASYYADGHQALAMLGTAFGLPAQESVNLTQIVWFALTGLLVFQAGKTLFEMSGRQGGAFAGLLSLLLVMFVSTPRGFLSALSPGPGWWWWEASRVLSDGGTELITEFPFFSFQLGDNHAHLIGLPLLLFSLLAGGNLLRARRIDFPTALLPVLLIFWSWRVNPWQTPTTLAVPLICLGLRKRGLDRRELRSLGLALLPSLLLLTPARAAGPELGIALNRSGFSGPVGAVKVFGFLLPGLGLLFFQRPVHRLCLLLTLLICGMFLCAETVYLKDLFQNRMNTVFKVYYQIWVLAGLLAAVGWAMWMQSRSRSGVGPLKWTALAAVLLPGLVYAGALSLQALRKPSVGLNAWNTLSPEDRLTLTVADALIQPGERIAEAPGVSFDPDSSLLGTWTAGNTLLGWTGHQRQWRPDQDWPDVSAIYGAKTRERLQAMIRAFDLQWIAVGAPEREKYDMHPDWDRWLDEFTFRVVDLPERKLYRVR